MVTVGRKIFSCMDAATRKKNDFKNEYSRGYSAKTVKISVLIIVALLFRKPKNPQPEW